jgi:hypothetical protein
MFAILYALGMFVADLFKSRRRLEAENLFLRHQLNIALRRAPPRLRLRGSDRALLVWMTRIWPNLRDLALVVKPATILDTAVRYGLPFVCAVGNDARWNSEYQIQLRAYGSNRLNGCELLPTRYDRVATAFGGYGELVTSAKEVGPAAKRALKSGLPACINIMIEGHAAPNITVAQ